MKLLPSTFQKMSNPERIRRHLFFKELAQKAIFLILDPVAPFNRSSILLIPTVAIKTTVTTKTTTAAKKIALTTVKKNQQ